MRYPLSTLLILLGFLTAAHGQPTLKEAFKGQLLVGAALNGSHISGTNADNCEIALVESQFNSISPENILKWEPVHPSADTYNFGPADRYVEFGVKSHMFIVGHTLVWHSQTPRWVFEDAEKNPVGRDTLLKRMHDHIASVVGRYKGRINGWDVVNEALNEDGTLRKSRWLQIIGEDYILKAYQFAHEADPGAELYYNEFSLENPIKRQGAIELIRNLQSHGIPIKAVGLQGHYKMNWPSPALLDETIQAFGALGVKVSVTEFDMDVLPPATASRSADVGMRLNYQAKANPYTNGLPDSVQQELASRYAALFRVFLKNAKVMERVTFWGVTDRNSWLNDWPVRGRTSHPLLFDRNCKPKPAFDAVIATAAR